MFKDTPIEVLEEEGLAGVLEEAVEAIEADEETEAGESEAEEESWVGEAWETAEQVVKENAEKVGGKVVGRWTGPEEWERTAMGDKHGDKGTREERMPEEWEMGEREADAQAQTVPEGWEMGEQVEGESELGSQTGWEVGEASEGKAQPDMTEEGWLD